MKDKQLHSTSKKRSGFRKLWPRSTSRKILLIILFVLFLMSGGFIVVSEQNSFCNSCHIMNPYYASWQSSKHSEVRCLDCHVQPGFDGHLQSKINGLAQAVDCLLDRMSTKPNATITDSSCLRIGCHDENALISQPDEFPKDYKSRFTHKGHINVELNGMILSCATCHSHFEGEEHFNVNTQVCYICHFLKAEKNASPLVETKCQNCHDVPSEPAKRGSVEIDHSIFVDNKSDCEKCHKQQVEIVSDVSEAICLNCHDFRKPRDMVSSEIHESHFQGEKVECLACHQVLKHESVPKLNFTNMLDSENFHSGFSSPCDSCHSDPHAGQFNETCDQCHSEQDWKLLQLADMHEANSIFPLIGSHLTVTCEKCHNLPHENAKLAEAQFVDLPGNCSDCHQDPHSGQFTQNCDQCHIENGWKGRWVNDAHDQNAPFPLKGKHAQAECQLCHKPSQPDAKLAEAHFADLPRNCNHCHEDPHNQQMQRSCETCHTEHGWIGSDLLFSHNKHSEFSLDAIHDDLDCFSCHSSADKVVYRPLLGTCSGCHTDIDDYLLGKSPFVEVSPDPHSGRVTCTGCHMVDQPSQSPAEYAQRCANCHNQHYQDLFYDWSKSLHNRQVQAEKSLNNLREKNIDNIDDLIEKCNLAKIVGLHNLSLSHQLSSKALQDSK